MLRAFILGSGRARRHEHRARRAVSGPTALSTRVTNPWFPLLPGSTYEYRGYKDGQPARDVLTVTHQTRRIRGVNGDWSFHDRLYLGGHLGERTTDWYTQDKAGNVWYFGSRPPA